MINQELKNVLVKLLKEYTNRIETGNSNISTDEATRIISVISHVEMTKEEACDYLNIRRSRFDDVVREGKLPRGKSVKHKHHLVWYKDELLTAIK